MIGAIYGDVCGSVFEFSNIKTKSFELFSEKSFFTDDTIMTVAVADSLLEFDKSSSTDVKEFKSILIDKMHIYGKKYPNGGYGGRFLKWLLTESRVPYFSYGNGSAMRVSPIAWYAKSLDDALILARASAEVTHNHPEGIKGAEAISGAIFLARKGGSMVEIKKFVSNYYKIDFTLDSIRDTYRFNETCQETVPQALQAFFESTSFEDSVRNAISIGGDSDTLAAICGSVAEAYYGITEDEKSRTVKYLDGYLLGRVTEFCEKYCV